MTERLSQASSIVTIAVALLAVVRFFLSDPVRNRVAAFSERRARRRIDSLLARITTAGGIVRDPGRFQIFMLHQLLQALVIFALAFFLIINTTSLLGAGAESRIGVWQLVQYWVGLVLLFGGAINVMFALGPSSDVIYFGPRVVGMVVAIERLRGRYPNLAASYPDFSEVTAALAELRGAGVQRQEQHAQDQHPGPHEE